MNYSKISHLFPINYIHKNFSKSMLTILSDLFQAYKATQSNGPATLYTAFHWQVFDVLTLQKKKKKSHFVHTFIIPIQRFYVL